MLDEEFAHLKPSPHVRYADYVVSGMGADDTVDGMTRIKRFKKDKFPEILVSVNMLDTGFDCPEVVNLVFARFTRSVTLYRQMRGRGTRKAKGKPLFTLFDFVGVTDFHQDEETYGEAGKVRETKGPYKPKPTVLVTVDTDDWIDPTTRAWIGYDAQGNVVFPELDEAKAQALGARFEGWLVDQEVTPDQERWLHWVESQIRENADIFDDFTLDHLEFPPFSLQGGRRKAAALFGGAGRLAAVVADLGRAVFSRGGDARPPH